MGLSEASRDAWIDSNQWKCTGITLSENFSSKQQRRAIQTKYLDKEKVLRKAKLFPSKQNTNFHLPKAISTFCVT